MVQVRKSFPARKDGSLDVDAWIDLLVGFGDADDCERMRHACAMAAEAERNDVSVSRYGKIKCFTAGLEMATILSELHLDETALIAAVIYRAVREQHVHLDVVRKKLGQDVAQLVEGVLRMAAISAYRGGGESVLGQQQKQAENIRKMLVAMVDDVRVGVLKLAERTQAIRSVKNHPAERQRKVAQEVFDIYAPLAHRLGIGQIKWELEDLSFRYLHASDYAQIAELLKEKRITREGYIDNVIDMVGQKLAPTGIKASISGRAKHIYSIWRKMRRKGVPFEQLYDLRAIRILVPEISDCYTCLGLVHTTWRNIPAEFDDYIANPKPNGYRSLHTAVVGPENKVVEVQIRTSEMHQEAELGVCAHWLYKGTDTDSSAGSYEQKIEWLREVLKLHDEAGEDPDHIDFQNAISKNIENDRVYVLTPKGHVIDLHRGSTPVDFAYHIHTEVGHKCRGARINGRIAPLNTVLRNGQQVEVITGKEAKPNRDWLRPSLGFLHSSSARAKVSAFFRRQERGEKIASGRQILEKELKRLHLTSLDVKLLAKEFSFAVVDDFYAKLGSSELGVGQVVRRAELIFQGQNRSQPSLFAEPSRKQVDVIGEVAKKADGETEVAVSGVGNLLTTQAGCCRPVPGDEVIGYVSTQRGITVHRKDCSEFLLMENAQPERVLPVTWDAEAKNFYSAVLQIEAYDRTGLLSDITGLLSAMRVNVTGLNTHSDQQKQVATMRVTLEIVDLQQLARIIGRLGTLPNVISVERYS